jgi:hypothetical protein
MNNRVSSCWYELDFIADAMVIADQINKACSQNSFDGI